MDPILAFTETLARLFSLNQGKRFKELIQSSETAWKSHQYDSPHQKVYP
ncbi:MAG: hypothetical protein WAW61_12875 [Methylococcaceae bacterium]